MLATSYPSIQPAAVAGSPQAVVLDEAAQLLTFSHDVALATISCVKLLSCYNAVAFAPHFHLPAGIDQFAPSYPHSFKLLEGSELMRGLSPATRSGLKGFAFYLGRAREEVLRLVEKFGARSILVPADVAVAAETTNGAACFATLAISDVRAIERRNGREFEVAQLCYFGRLLDEVIGGRSPLWADGRLLEVRDDFRLRERRVKMTAVAMVIGQQRQEQVIVTNLSRGGLGFQTAAEFMPGQVVEVDLLEPRRYFKAQVVWRRGLSTGVHFAVPLSDEDPLLIPLLSDENFRLEP